MEPAVRWFLGVQVQPGLIGSAYSRHAVKIYVLRRRLFLAENVTRFRPKLFSWVYQVDSMTRPEPHYISADLLHNIVRV
jgi:hypothetical protein